MLFFLILLSLFLHSFPVSSKISWGFCPSSIPLQPSFQFKSYLGDWFEIAKSNSVNYLEKGSCGIDRYSEIAPKTANVHWTEILENKEVRELNQTLTCEDTGQCWAKFQGWLPAADYKLVSTDYKNFAVVYSCMGFGVFHFEMLWILGREKTLMEDSWKVAREIAGGIGFGEEELVMENVTTCEFYELEKQSKRRDL